MKKTNILLGAFFCALITQTGLFGADSPEPLPKRAPHNRTITPTPRSPESNSILDYLCCWRSRRAEQPTRAVGPGSLCQVAASCCCKADTVESFIQDVQILHQILDFLVRFAPNYAIQLYLLASNGTFFLSNAAAVALDHAGLLDEKGNIKEGWRDMILTMLKHPNDDTTHPYVYYMQQAVIALSIEFPGIIDLIKAQEGNMEAFLLDANTLDLLHSRYKIINNNTTITAEEIDTILSILRREESAGDSRTPQGHTPQVLPLESCIEKFNSIESMVFKDFEALKIHYLSQNK